MPLRPPTRAGTGRAEARKGTYKAAVRIHDSRRRCEDSLVAIRKNKRGDSLTKKRRDALLQQQSQPEAVDAPPTVADQELDSLSVMVQGVCSENSEMQLKSIIQFRKLLSIPQNPPIKEVIKAGVVPRFVEFLSRHDLPQLQFEAAWALTNITSGTSEDTKVVIDSNAVPEIIQLLSSSNDDVREQAVWALGNIAGDSPSCRDVVLSNGALLPLLAQLNEHSKLSMLRNCTWALSNFCGGKPPAPFELIKPALQILQQLIYSRDQEILADACWAISYISVGRNDRIQALLDANICPRLLELLHHPLPSVLIPVIKTVGNILTGDDAQTQFIIDLGVLPCLLGLLSQGYQMKIKKEACWAISNITAGNEAQIQAVIDSNIIAPLVQLLQHAEFDLKKEAAWAISNATRGGSAEQIIYLVRQGCIKPLCDLLVSLDPLVVILCLEGLECILKVGEMEKDLGKTDGVNLHAQVIEECDGVDKIENFQGHDNIDIYEKAIKLLEAYWIEEEDEAQDVEAE